MVILLSACTRSPPPPACPDGMVLIEAGTWTLGETVDPGRFIGGWIPAHSVELPAYCVDTYPFPGREGADWTQDGLTWDGLMVLQADLRAFGRRPCSVSELMRAAAGPENRRYPTDAVRWDKERCDGDDHHPQPLGTFDACRTPEGVHDFQVRSSWGTLDEPTRAAFLEQWPPESLWFETFAVWGGTARTDTFYAPNNFGIHFHGPGVSQFEDDNFRVCADPGGDRDDEGYERWLDAFIARGTYAGLIR